MIVDMLQFEIAFYSPFAVATGHARRGVDVTIDKSDPLSGSSLKGVMRSAARQILPAQPDLVGRTFGRPSQPSAWSWSRASFADVRATQTRARVAIDSQTGRAADDFLMFGEELWSDKPAIFSVTQQHRIDDDAERANQILVLAASAQAVHALGRDRRRGMGWVGIRCLTQGAMNLTAFRSLR